MDVIKLGLGGFGTVGSGLAKILDSNAERIEKRLGKRLEIKTVLVRDLNKKRAFDLGPNVTFTDDPSALINSDVDIVVELMGGVDTAKQLILDAFKAGKHVVTANKHLLAEHGLELFDAAQENRVGLMFEASCAGGIPIVQTLKESLAGDEIIKMLGIMNGTANYILSEMTTKKGMDFASALADAQDLGYAEADPTFDIEGLDTAHKLCVLIRMAYGVDYPLSEIPIQGITSVTPMDIEFAREFGYRIKLLAHVENVRGKLEAGVHPALVPYTYLLARVGGNYNAVRLEGNAVGPIMLHGQGAGDLPTGSAVLADVMNLARKIGDKCRQPDNTGFGNAPIEKAVILPPEQSESKYYFRFTVTDRTGVMATITKSMADHGVSIAQAVQKGEAGAEGVPLVIISHETPAKAVNAMIAEVDAMDFTVEPCVTFRIL